MGRSAARIIPVAEALEHVLDKHRPLNEVARAVRRALLPRYRGITMQGVLDTLVEAVSAGLAHEGANGHGARTIGQLPPAQADTATNRAIAYWHGHPEATVREVAEAVGCAASTASSARPRGVR